MSCQLVDVGAERRELAQLLHNLAGDQERIVPHEGTHSVETGSDDLFLDARLALLLEVVDVEQRLRIFPFTLSETDRIGLAPMCRLRTSPTLTPVGLAGNTGPHAINSPVAASQAVVGPARCPPDCLRRALHVEIERVHADQEVVDSETTDLFKRASRCVARKPCLPHGFVRTFFRESKRPQKSRCQLPRCGPFRAKENPFKPYRPPSPRVQGMACSRRPERLANPRCGFRKFW